MREYSHEAWVELGRSVRRARKELGYRNTAEWADMVGRSTRAVLGLERGEPVGEDTLEQVDRSLGKHVGWSIEFLSGSTREPAVSSAPERVVTEEDVSDDELLAMIRVERARIDVLLEKMERRIQG